MKIIAKIHNGFSSKFGIPRQSGLAGEVLSTIVFEKEFRNPDALRGLEDFSHLWLIWDFSLAHREEWSPTVRPPRLGGNTRMGVFATRSPFRPNPIGLSSVKMEKILLQGEDGPVIVVSGADLMDGTPIFDIKPYLPYADCHPEAKGGFAAGEWERRIDVSCDEEILKQIPPEHQKAVLELLAQDPRPSYQHDEKRVYGMEYAGMDIRFQVEGSTLRVREIIRKDGK